MKHPQERIKNKAIKNLQNDNEIIILPGYKGRMTVVMNKSDCYIASAETKRDWLIHGHVALDKCNVSLGQ